MSGDVADWCLFTKTEGGKVSLIKGLTRDEAIQAARLASPWHMRPSAPDSYCLDEDPHRIDDVKVFRGTGETANFWEGWKSA